MIEKDVFAPKIMLRCGINQAVEILAFNYYPVDDEILLDTPRKRYNFFSTKVNYYNDIHRTAGGKEYFVANNQSFFIDNDELEYYRKSQKAFAQLRRLIKNNLLTMEISYSEEDDEFGVDSTTCESISDFSYISYTSTYSEYAHKFYIGAYGYLREDSNHKVNVSIIFNTEEVMHYYNVAQKIKAKPQLVNNNYSTIYLDIINEMIAENKISKDNQRTIKELKYEIIEMGKKYNISITPTLAGNMATVMRLPEAQKGGNKKR